MDRAELARQIEVVSQTGYAITYDQMILSEIGIACAIRGPDARGYGAIHCSVSAHRWDEQSIKSKILPWLLDAANAT
jgi:DNA-binding IclR family transcriptional regulator